MRNINDPFSDLALDEEEQLLEAAFDKGEFEEISSLEATKKMLEEAAKRHRQLNTPSPLHYARPNQDQSKS